MENIEPLITADPTFPKPFDPQSPLTKPNKKNNNFLNIFLMGLPIFIAGATGYYLGTQSPTVGLATISNELACTEELQKCPNGSFVSRIPPNCEFAPCPVFKEATPPPEYSSNPAPQVGGWKKYTNEYVGFTLEYPDFLPDFRSNINPTQATDDFSFYRWISTNYPHITNEISVNIEGPLEGTEGVDVLTWIKDKGWGYEKPGKYQEGPYGVTQVKHYRRDNNLVIETKFTDSGMLYPSDIDLYFATEKGIYQVYAKIVAEEKDYKEYQVILNRVAESLDFIE